MDRRSILTVGATAGLGLLSRSAMAQAKTIKEQIVGSWTLVSWVQTRGDGTKNFRSWRQSQGRQYVRPQWTLFTHYYAGRSTQTRVERCNEADGRGSRGHSPGAIAYFGTYTVDEAAKTLTLQIDGTTLPNQLGLPQKRNIDAISAEEMRYSNANAVGGGSIEVAWKRG